jgi:hypothetical protein
MKAFFQHSQSATPLKRPSPIRIIAPTQQLLLLDWKVPSEVQCNMEIANMRGIAVLGGLPGYTGCDPAPRIACLPAHKPHIGASAKPASSTASQAVASDPKPESSVEQK